MGSIQLPTSEAPEPTGVTVPPTTSGTTPSATEAPNHRADPSAAHPEMQSLEGQR